MDEKQNTDLAWSLDQIISWLRGILIMGYRRPAVAQTLSTMEPGQMQS